MPEQSGNMFGQHIAFNIDPVTRLAYGKVSCLISVWDDRHFHQPIVYRSNCQTDAVDGDRALVDEKSVQIAWNPHHQFSIAVVEYSHPRRTS